MEDQIRYHYDSDGKLTKVTYPTTKNGVQALAYEYDQNGWLTKIKGEVQSGDGSTEKTVRSYTYDSYGKVKEIKDYRDLLNSSDQAVKKAYTYDSLDRVKEMTYTDLETGKVMESYRYSYDKNSNITEKTEVNNYPKEEKDKVNETKAYTYDAENRLSKVSVTDKDGKTAVIQQNRYNGDGQRIQKVEGSKTTNYYYQDGVVSYTTDGDNSQTSQNLIGTDGNILATQRYGSDHTDYLLYHKDIQGSTTSLVKEDGSADATYQYTDFGETTINGDNKAENEVCYTGGIYDQSTGLYYLNARYYNPEDGRFVTEDTYRGETAKPETGHLYAYCANNPVNYVDPSGHKYTTRIWELLWGTYWYDKSNHKKYGKHGNAKIAKSAKNKNLIQYRRAINKENQYLLRARRDLGKQVIRSILKYGVGKLIGFVVNNFTKFTKVIKKIIPHSKHLLFLKSKSYAKSTLNNIKKASGQYKIIKSNYKKIK